MLTESERLRRKLGKLMAMEERAALQLERDMKALIKLCKRLEGERSLLKRLPPRIDRAKKKLAAELRQERKADARSAAASIDPEERAPEGEPCLSHSTAAPTCESNS